MEHRDPESPAEEGPIRSEVDEYLDLPSESYDSDAELTAQQSAELVKGYRRSDELTAQQAAEYVGASSYSYFRQLAGPNKYDIPARWDGARKLYRRSDLDDFMKRWNHVRGVPSRHTNPDQRQEAQRQAWLNAYYNQSLARRAAVVRARRAELLADPITADPLRKKWRENDRRKREKKAKEAEAAGTQT
jgi:hypothetical protein